MAQLRHGKQARLSSETDEQREARLAQLRHGKQARLSSETDEQREARLTELRHGKQARLSSETDEQREARLAQLHQDQQLRLSSETVAERQLRLQRDIYLHQRTRSIDTTVPLLNQPAVHKKIEKFHSDLCNLTNAFCPICHELLLGNSVGSSNYSCQRCTRDSSLPKLYSLDNNMDPGLVPSQLQVH